jgi:ApaG protein
VEPLRELEGLSVTIDEVVYAPELGGSPDKPHRFVYFITIHNGSSETVTIKGRKWVVRELDGEVTAVEGDGVVGEFPRLESGASFSYNSSHIIALDAAAEGAYLAATDAGEAVFTRIPKFEMLIPE